MDRARKNTTKPYDRNQHDGDEAGRCGGCGSRSLIVDTTKMHAICRDCHRLQELETRDFPESQMCDNCAFRKGSPERADPYRWAEILSLVEDGRPFHCHKGLSMRYPAKGDTAFFTPPTAGEQKVCAGWLAMRVKELEKAKEQVTP